MTTKIETNIDKKRIGKDISPIAKIINTDSDKLLPIYIRKHGFRPLFP